jgi:ribose transport system substrate-binding protein
MQTNGRRAAAMAAVALLLTVVAAACGSSSSTGGATTNASSVKPVAGHPVPVKNTTHKHFNITMIAAANNPFADQVETGFNTAKAVLSAYGVTSTFIDAGADVTSQAVGTGIETAISQGANAIAAQLPDNQVCYYIKQATAHHIAFAGFNGDVSCAQQSGALFFHGQQFLTAGEQAAKLMCQATAGLASKSHPGKVGIATESFTFEALVERTQGFEDGLKQDCPWVTPINTEGVEYADSSVQQLTSDTENFVSSTPNLVGIYVTGGNPFAASQEIGALHKQAKVKVVGFDLVPQNVTQIEKGYMYGTVTQDPFGQSYDTMVWLYNYLVTGKKPSSSYILPTQDMVVTKSNLASAVAAQTSGT